MGLALHGLNDSERRSIAEGLFTVKKVYEEKGEMTGLCPFHQDDNPSFSYNYRKDVFNCSAGQCGATGDLISLWIHVKGLDEKQGFVDFCREYNINQADHGWTGKRRKPRPREEKFPPLDDVFAQLAMLPASWMERLSKERGWSAEVIEQMELRLQDHYQDKKTGEIKQIRQPDRVAMPIRDRQGSVRNIRLYQPKWFRKEDSKFPKIFSWGENYGAARLYPASPDDRDPVLLCEGEPDRHCAHSYGFNAVTLTTKPKKWSREHAAEFEGRDVVICYDADQAGQKYADEFTAPELAKVARSVKILEWPDFMGRRPDNTWPEDHGEDLTDFFIKHGKSADDLWALIDEAPDVDILKYVSRQAQAFFERGLNDRLSFKPRLLAEKIMEDMQVLSDPETGLIYRWNGRFWENFAMDHIENYALRLLGGESQRSRSQDSAYQVKILSTLPHGRAVNDCQDWVCLKNGMLNLRTNDFKLHDTEYYSTYELPVRFNPDSPRLCSRWLDYLNQTIQTPAAILQIQEYVGYCLTRSTIHAKSLLLVGPGSDGKSVFLKILRELVGTENCSSVSFADLEDQFLRSSLYQKSVNISTEVGTKALESPYFKAITSGDPINAAFKHKNTFTFIPYCKLVFAANKLPRVLDNSDGFFRRILPIMFKRQFLEGDPDTDPHLLDKLTGELSEIFCWALAGLRRLWRQGSFTDCDETQDLMMGYKRLNNPVVCFVDDLCVIDPEAYETKKDVFTKYRSYCNANGYHPLSKENFFRELYSAVNNLRTMRPRTGGGRDYVLQGLRLTIEAEL